VATFRHVQCGVALSGHGLFAHSHAGSLMTPPPHTHTHVTTYHTQIQHKLTLLTAPLFHSPFTQIPAVWVGSVLEWRPHNIWHSCRRCCFVLLRCWHGLQVSWCFAFRRTCLRMHSLQSRW
jgi:hypothetical protein